MLAPRHHVCGHQRGQCEDGDAGSSGSGPRGHKRAPAEKPQDNGETARSIRSSSLSRHRNKEATLQVLIQHKMSADNK